MILQIIVQSDCWKKEKTMPDQEELEGMETDGVPAPVQPSSQEKAEGKPMVKSGLRAREGWDPCGCTGGVW